MDEDTYWSAVRTLRLRTADLVESLDATDCDVPSLCAGWRVLDVAGHVALVPRITTWDMVRAAPSARFDPSRINTRLAVREGRRRREDIVGDLREHAGVRRTARVLSGRDCLFDVIVHSQDIARPLGRVLDVPAAWSRQGLQRVWEMGWPFRAGRHLAGLTLTATDTDWTVGDGPEVRGEALSLLLLLTGRRAAVVDSLDGSGVHALHA